MSAPDRTTAAEREIVALRCESLAAAILGDMASAVELHEAARALERERAANRAARKSGIRVLEK